MICMTVFCVLLHCIEYVTPRLLNSKYYDIYFKMHSDALCRLNCTVFCREKKSQKYTACQWLHCLLLGLQACSETRVTFQDEYLTHFLIVKGYKQSQSSHAYWILLLLALSSVDCLTEQQIPTTHTYNLLMVVTWLHGSDDKSWS